MVRSPHSTSLLTMFMLGAITGAATAQPDLTTPPQPEVAPADAAPPAPPETAADLLRRVRDLYATTSLAQRGSITLQDSEGRSVTSPVAFSVARSDPDARPTLALRLGHALLFSLDDRHLRGVHLANSSLLFERSLSDHESALDALQSALPPLAVPPLIWAASGTEVPVEAAFWMLEDPRFDSRVLSTSASTLVVMGQSARGPFELTIDAATLRLTRMLALIGPPDAPARFTLRLDQPAEPARLAFPPIEAAPGSGDGRTRVATVAELKPRLPEISTGSRLPSLGLMGQDLSAWSLDAALARPAPPSLVGKMDPPRAVLILFVPGVDASLASPAARSARAAAEAAHTLAQEYQRRTVLGDYGLPMVATIPVAVVEVGELDPEVVAQTATAWEPAAGQAPVWTTGGRQLMSRLIAGATAVAVVIDHEQRVLGTVPLDAGLEPDAVATELRRLLESRP